MGPSERVGHGSHARAAIRRPLQSIYEDVKSDVSHIKTVADINAPDPVTYSPSPEPQRPAIRRDYDDMT